MSVRIYYTYRVCRPLEMEVRNGGIMREIEVERAFVKAVKVRNGLCLKFISPGFSGVPDRIVLFQNGKLVFVEVKAPGEKLRPLQEKRKRQLEALGFLVFNLDNKAEIGVILDVIQAT